MRVHQGHIWLATLDPALANEQRGFRPCLVISSDRFNALPIRQAIVVPLTTRERGFPHHVLVADDGRLNRASWAMCEAVRAVSTQRFEREISTATEDTLNRVIKQLTLWLTADNRSTG